MEISYTDKEITSLDGLVLMRKVLDKLDFGKHIDDCADLPQPGSNRGAMILKQL